ncbi:MAG: DUF58 domain-containing protein [Verrucomicrobiota bacterium]
MIRRLVYRGYRLVAAVAYRVSRRFTKAGLSVLAGLAVTAGLGFDTEQTMSYQVFSLLLALLLVAIVFTFFFRVRMAASRILPRFGTAGCPLRYRVVLKNNTAKAQSGLVLLENLADPRPTCEDFIAEQLAEEQRLKSLRLVRKARSNGVRMAQVKEQPLSQLPPRHEAEVQIEMMPLKRGALRFTGLTIARPDPFGLCKAFITLPMAQSVLILPKRYPLPPIALPGTRKYQPGGVAMASAVGESEEFISLREYRQGDPLRHIHWKSWAKVGRPIVKEYQDEFFVRHALVLDTFLEAGSREVFEEAVSVAASFACTVQTQESLLDLMFVGVEAFCFTAGRGLAHTDQMLEILASVRVCREKQFNSLLRLVLEHVAALSGCICIFLSWDAQRKKFVEYLKMIGVPLLVLIMTEEGAAGALDPGPLRDQPECFHVLEAGKVEEGLASL